MAIKPNRLISRVAAVASNIPGLPRLAERIRVSSWFADASDSIRDVPGLTRGWALVRNTGVLLFEAFREWRKDDAANLGAALAYYTVFSLGPVLVIAISVAGLVFGADAARGQIFAQFRALIGDRGAQFLQDSVQAASRPTSGVLGTIVGVAVLVFGAGGVFQQLQSSLNQIWDVPPSPKIHWRKLLLQRLTSYVMVIGVGFLLLVSLVISAGLAAISHILTQWMTGTAVMLNVANEVVQLLALTVLFALMFKFLPDKKITWRDVWVGSAIAAVLFEVGKVLIGMYVSRSHLDTAYGVAGSIAVVLVWLYYSAQIFFFGAECTQVYAERFGSRLVTETEQLPRRRREKPRKFREARRRRPHAPHSSHA